MLIPGVTIPWNIIYLFYCNHINWHTLSIFILEFVNPQALQLIIFSLTTLESILGGYNDTQHIILNNVFNKKKSVSLVYRIHSFDKVSTSTILQILTAET
jgi:hypothetical protein